MVFSRFLWKLTSAITGFQRSLSPWLSRCQMIRSVHLCNSQILQTTLGTALTVPASHFPLPQWWCFLPVKSTWRSVYTHATPPSHRSGPACAQPQFRAVWGLRSTAGVGWAGQLHPKTSLRKLLMVELCRRQDLLLFVKTFWDWRWDLFHEWGVWWGHPPRGKNKLTE